MRKFKIPHQFQLITIIELYARWIREGKLQVNSQWNREIQAKFTVQDPCNIGRKTGSNRIVDDLRFVVKTVVGEENFIDTIPNRMNNFCCGGGGGALQAGLPDQRRAYGKIKFNQIMDTGADYVIAPCHNCHGQIEDMAHHHGGNYRVVHLWTIICLAMGILAETERTYLGPDLAEVNLNF
ncbi:MAG: (Fe-S)-binding protein [Desulfobacterales bacterium]|nr:(Fe-S)-binding protein [Desulfobacterales bacterium]